MTTIIHKFIMRRPVLRYLYLSLLVQGEGHVSLTLDVQCPFRRMVGAAQPKEAQPKEAQPKEAQPKEAQPKETQPKDEKSDETEEDLVEAMAKLRITTARSKSLTKYHEDQDVGVLVEMLQRAERVERVERVERGQKGEELRRLFQETFPGKEVVGAEREVGVKGQKAGGRSVHYDFRIQARDVTTGELSWLRVEHKGSSVYKPLDGALPPWTGGVQFFNGGMEKYRLCRKYAEAWYERFIGSGFLSVEYGLMDVEIPSLEEWIQRDARVQGDPKTEFGMALKRAVRLSGKESLRDLRDVFVPDFVSELTDQDKAEFLEDVAPILRDSLGQKDVWLQVAGDVAAGQFHARWSPALSVGSVTGVEWSSTKDVVGTILTDCAHPIRFILRWGKGAGFSNLRLDLK